MSTKSFGTSIKIGTGPGTVVAKVKSISGPKISVDTIDSSTHDQANNWRTFIPTMIDGGEVEVTAEFNSLSDLNVAYTKVGVIDTDFEISWPIIAAAVKATFKGIVAGFEWSSNEVDTQLEYTFTIKITGIITLA